MQLKFLQGNQGVDSLPCRKFMGVPSACGRAEAVVDESGIGASAAATDASAAAWHQPPQLAGFGGSSALAAAGLCGKDAQSDALRRPVLLNPEPPAGDAAPVPAARTLPAATLEAVFRRLPHYASHLDRHPMWVYSSERAHCMQDKA